jgi:hypothetical protein
MSIAELENVAEALKDQKAACAEALREIEANLCMVLINLSRAREGRR